MDASRCQTVYKPGSVPRLPAAMAIPLGRSLRSASSNQPGRRRGKRLRCGEAATPSLFGLAPGEVCRAGPIAGPAVRSYRTFSPLPSGLAAGRRSTSLWHCLGGRPRRALPGTVLPWSPDFPRPKAVRLRPRPSDRLAQSRIEARNTATSRTLSGPRNRHFAAQRILDI